MLFAQLAYRLKVNHAFLHTYHRAALKLG